MFYLTKHLIINKCLTIKCPFTSNIITTSDYFLTKGTNNCAGVPNDVMCNYHFIKEGIIVVFSLACNDKFNNMYPVYILSLNKSKIISIHINGWSNIPVENYQDYYRKICKILKKLKYSSNESPALTTLYGSVNALGHTLFNELTGLFILDYNKLTPYIDNVIVGPYDPYSISKYFERNNIKVSKFNDWGIFNTKIGKGACVKYSHVFISQKCCDFVLNHLKNCRGENALLEDTYTTSEEIINKGKQVITIVLRCGERTLYNQVDVIVKVINALVKLVPDIFILFDGFSKPSDDNIILGVHRPIVANELREEYKRTVDAICKRIHTKEFKSLIDEPIYTCVDWLGISKIGVYIWGSGCVNAGWLCKVPGIQFGSIDIEKYKEIDNIICENNPNIYYLTDGIEYKNGESVVHPITIVNEIMKLNILNIPDKSRVAVDILNIIASSHLSQSQSADITSVDKKV